MTSGIMSRRTAIFGVFGALAASSLAACAGQDDHYSPPTTRGDRAAVRVGERGPDFTLPDAAGQPVALHDFRGKPTIVVFFRTFG